MRRLALVASLLAVVGALVAILGSSAQGSDTYRFDVIFDDARGLVSGQLVKIAGAQAGTISDVTVTRDYKARVAATVPGSFRMHTDATCTIRPQGLIAENYVECDPGSPGAPLLRAGGGQPPTVPVTHTTEPVSLQDLFNIFNLPTRERFQVLVDELGIATAGQGDSLNAVLRRANPALQLANRVIGILDRQKAELATIIDATSTIAGEGAAHTAAVQSFITRAQALTSLTADHSSSLSLAVGRLPGLLAAAQPALGELDTVARQGTPLLASIRTAVPAVNRVSRDIGPFAAVAGPALQRISGAITAAVPAIRSTTPLVDSINAYIKRSASNTALFAKLSSNLQRHGFVENFLSILYYVTAALSRYDSTSHMLALLFVGPNGGACGSYATKPVPGCSAHMGQQPAYTPEHRRSRRAAARRGSAATPGTARTTTTTAATPTATTPAKHGPLSGVTGTVGKVLSSVASGTSTTPSQQGSGGPLQNLINYLLK